MALFLESCPCLFPAVIFSVIYVPFNLEHEMVSPLLTAVLSFLFVVHLTSAATSHALRSRTVSLSSRAAGQPGINTKITSDNGTDISSQFKTLVYIPTDEELALPNITDRDLSPRVFGGPGVRTIDHCRSPGAVFLWSMCDYHAEHPYSMQSYMVQCHIPNRRYTVVNQRFIMEQVSKKPSKRSHFTSSQ